MEKVNGIFETFRIGYNIVVRIIEIDECYYIVD
jgi:hypothetical protein